MKLNLKGIVLVLLLAGLASCGGIVEFQSIENTPVPYLGGKERTLDQVEKAIISGGVSSGWVTKSEGPGHLIGTLRMGGGKHVVVVDIIFNTKTYSIEYQYSTGLNYSKDPDGTEWIHPRVANWIQNFQNAIDREFRTM